MPIRELMMPSLRRMEVYAIDIVASTSDGKPKMLDEKQTTIYKRAVDQCHIHKIHNLWVAIIAPNIPALYEAHFGIPMAGAVINIVNVRLNAGATSFLLEHSGSAVVMVDQEFFKMAEEALKVLADKSKSFKPPLVIVIADENCDQKSLQYALGRGAVEYEKFLETGDPEFPWKPPQDEWKTIALGYTSGTTASPKGVVLHHRGAYLMALSNVVIWRMTEEVVYLWTLPVNHDLLQPYPVLHVKPGTIVAHIKFTVLLMPNGSDRVTSHPIRELEPTNLVPSFNTFAHHLLIRSHS